MMMMVNFPTPDLRWAPSCCPVMFFVWCAAYASERRESRQGAVD